MERIYLPIEKDVINREHIEREEESDDRIEAFVSRLNDTYEVGFSFEQNLKEYFTKNKTRTKVRDKVWDSVE